MEPEPVSLAQIGDLGERIDRAVAGGSAVRHHAERPSPGGSVLGHRALELSDVQAVTVVGRQLAKLILSEAEDPRASVDAGVGKLARINDAIGAHVAESRLAGKDQPGEVGDRTAAHQRAAGRLGQPEPAAKPVGDDQLELVRRRAFDPGARVDVVARRQRVAHGADEGAGARDEGEHPGVVDVRHVRRHPLAERLQQLLHAQPILGRGLTQQRLGLGSIQYVHDSLLAQRGVMVDQPIEHARAQPPHLRGRHLQSQFVCGTARLRPDHSTLLTRRSGAPDELSLTVRLEDIKPDEGGDRRLRPTGVEQRRIERRLRTPPSRQSGRAGQPSLVSLPRG